MNAEIFNRRMNVDVPPRCTLHQCVKNAYDEGDTSRRCIVCKNYKLNLNASKCHECLGTEHLDNFECDDKVKDSEWYRYLSENKQR